LLQFVSSSTVVTILASLAIVIASVNIFGGFLVTHRMLAMFKRS
jgi:NAD(P) transhydrogenase subunit alpha